MIIVTGGAGFIGSCVVARLNEIGHGDIIIVDHWDKASLKKKNLAGKKYTQFYDKDEFLSLILADRLKQPISHVIHMGACSSTTGTDRDYYMKNNFEYSCHVAQWSLARHARLIYASSAATYGEGENGYSDALESIRSCRPLNYYGESKQLFDEWVLDQNLYDRVAGLKFFNVFGPNEGHKGDMRSVIAKAYGKVVSEGRMTLFKSHRTDYADGEQKRDFIYVKDAVDIIMFFMDHPSVNGIFNAGTGEARTWNDVAKALFAAVGRPTHIDYIDMPQHLQSRYQYFTQADMRKLRTAGYARPFTKLEDAVKDYAGYLREAASW